MILEVLPDLLAYLDVTLLVAGISITAGSLLGGLRTAPHTGRRT